MLAIWAGTISGCRTHSDTEQQQLWCSLLTYTLCMLYAFRPTVYSRFGRLPVEGLRALALVAVVGGVSGLAIGAQEHCGLASSGRRCKACRGKCAPEIFSNSFHRLHSVRHLIAPPKAVHSRISHTHFVWRSWNWWHSLQPSERAQLVGTWRWLCGPYHVELASGDQLCVPIMPQLAQSVRVI